MAVSICISSKLKPFFFLFKCTLSLDATLYVSLNCKFFGFRGQLIHSTSNIIEIDTTVFHQNTYQVLVRTLPALQAALAGDPDSNIMVNPFGNGGADTKTIVIRKCITL